MTPVGKQPALEKKYYKSIIFVQAVCLRILQNGDNIPRILCALLFFSENPVQKEVIMIEWSLSPTYYKFCLDRSWNHWIWCYQQIDEIDWLVAALIDK